MSKSQAPKAPTAPKVKKVAEKTTKVSKPLQEPVVVKNVATVKKVVEKKAKPAAKKPIDKLSAHALKHVSSWHAKAGENGPEFAKLIAKHARTLLK